MDEEASPVMVGTAGARTHSSRTTSRTPLDLVTPPLIARSDPPGHKGMSDCGQGGPQ